MRGGAKSVWNLPHVARRHGALFRGGGQAKAVATGCVQCKGVVKCGCVKQRKQVMREWRAEQ